MMTHNKLVAVASDVIAPSASKSPSAASAILPVATSAPEEMVNAIKSRFNNGVLLRVISGKKSAELS
ncbi:unannotated protein [freshwater metagenome]|uniref:Unannotated protein n=1 Tax=freshwater metagenome TaxID=449393 RepID=A0A6J6Y0B6_9ZZZZ